MYQNSAYLRFLGPPRCDIPLNLTNTLSPSHDQLPNPRRTAGLQSLGSARVKTFSHMVPITPISKDADTPGRVQRTEHKRDNQCLRCGKLAVQTTLRATKIPRQNVRKNSLSNWSLHSQFPTPIIIIIPFVFCPVIQGLTGISAYRPPLFQ